ncbi:MAG: NAD(P) transhydrogenase subunit alpha [Coriobacteriia bacterium]|nr:NAD(P) transhydrogenase subunit alpha [Coriobacteriia bacterium]
MTEMALMLGIFAVTSVVSYLLISRIPQRLHTPLMAFTNAISAVTILGALLLFTHDVSPAEVVLGSLAIVMASFNLTGGFAITDRMTGMFKQ